jgi:hypothetical protein
VIQNKHVLWTASGSIQWEGNYRDLLGTKAAPSPKYKKFSAHEKGTQDTSEKSIIIIKNTEVTSCKKSPSHI